MANRSYPQLLCLPETFLRTARKSHTCWSCRLDIAKGERYAEYLGESASYQSGRRYHLGECADRQLGAGMTAALVDGHGAVPRGK